MQLRPRVSGSEAVSIDGRKFLAKKIDEAIAAAEKHYKREGFSLYPFLYGYLLGECSDAEIAAFDARIERLTQEIPHG